MSQNSSEIKISKLDDEASGPSGEGGLMRLVLRLSQPAPYEWCEYFNQAWRQNIYTMKRKAHASSDYIEIVCMPDELERDHIPELKKVIADTNTAYAKYVIEQQHLVAKQKAAEQKQKDELSDLKKNLKFD